GILFYTHSIVGQLVEREKKLVALYADIIQSFAQSTSEKGIDFFFLRDHITPVINFPVILTDEAGNPLEPLNQYTMNVELDPATSDSLKVRSLKASISDMALQYQPIAINDSDGRVISYVYYTNSSLVTRLRYLPYVEILIAASFIAIGYISFSYLKRNEESNIWVGMAKEAAHQLGTPLSSLMAWIELVRMDHDPSSRESTLSEMENDLHRLNIIANRFSLIGSKPSLRPTPLAQVIESVCTYYERRLPQLARHVSIVRECDPGIVCALNAELFSWVLENLIKNGVEAMESRDGRISIRVATDEPNRRVLLEVHDTGKGMNAKTRKQVFEPGFTTKTRGWGLGLSLSKRIVEEYHEGRIIVKHSAPGHGTTFLITLPIAIQS
ncbi:MAG: sensor histidine kinase, partial [Candidatus Kapaibacterium sp.]